MANLKQGRGSSVGVSPSKAAHKIESTRSSIGTIFAIGYILIISLFLASAMRNGLPTQDIKEILLAISAVLSGPLGFIIGYYFKNY